MYLYANALWNAALLWNNHGDGINMQSPTTTTQKTQGSGNGPSESVIRLMTRVAIQHKAVNLSQGFPNEPPPTAVSEALVRAVLGGVGSSSSTSLDALIDGNAHEHEHEHERREDELNQYSMPMGRPSLRRAVAECYERWYGYEGVDPETMVTITLGATEAIGSALRSLGSRPGDGVVVLEPYHELYPAQCRLCHLEPRFVTMKEEVPSNNNNNNNNKNNHKEGGRPTKGSTWTLDWEGLEAAMAKPDTIAMVLNTPHNPTGKVFRYDELRRIVDLAIRYDVFLVTDEIYEFMIYPEGNHGEASRPPPHYVLPQTFPEVADRTFVCNSMGKSCSATGWRIGWCIHPPAWAETYRGVHDQSVVMAPHPMQYAAETYLSSKLDGQRKSLATLYKRRLTELARALQDVGFGVGGSNGYNDDDQHENVDDAVLLPEGAYYLFVRYRSVPGPLGRMEKPMEAAMYMVQKVGVACVPGDNFYGHCLEDGRNYLRFAACRSEADVREACRRIRDHWKQL